MTVVLVHGNPETAAIWDPLRSELGRDDVVALSPPGFGAPAPDGFGATSDDYLAWLVGELEHIAGPIALIGHDWGGGHVQRVAATRCTWPPPQSWPIRSIGPAICSSSPTSQAT